MGIRRGIAYEDPPDSLDTREMTQKRAQTKSFFFFFVEKTGYFTYYYPMLKGVSNIPSEPF